MVVIYVFLLEEAMYFYCYLCILIVSLCVVYVFLDAATLIEVFPCFFLSCKAKGKSSQDRARPALPQIVVLFYVLFVLCRSVYCLCVNVYCTTATG